MGLAKSPSSQLPIDLRERGGTYEKINRDAEA